MRLRTILSVFILTVLAPVALAGPVAGTRAVYTQPDGTTINVRISGDEWTKVRTTEDGCAIRKDADGWWCYATYDNEGKITCSQYHVGKPAPAEVISFSRTVPHNTLSQRSRRQINNINAINQREVIKRQAAVTKTAGAKIQQRGLALLVQFSDTKFTFKKENFVDLLNLKDYKGTGSAKDYYEDQFGEGWEFTFDVSDIITLSWPAEHYGKNDADDQDIRPWDMVAEACTIADETIDFSQYDIDNDGFVDNVYIFYAGLSEAENSDEPDLIWPHQYYIYQGEGIRVTCDGKQIDRYACSAEITGERSLTGIGAFCHEYGHTFGLVDLYDTDYDQEGEWAAGVWRSTSLMDAGSYNNNSATPPYFNCIEREMLGLSEGIVLEEGKSYTLEPIQKSGTFYKLETGTPGEYYLFECRSNSDWDRYIGGKGMLVYHIDKNERTTIGGYSYSKWDMNMVNSTLEHQCADLIEADGRSDRIFKMEDLYGNISGIFFPYRTVNSIGTDKSPALKFWNGRSSQLAITSISYSNNNVSFIVRDKNKIQDAPSVTNAISTTFPDAAIISFESSNPDLEGFKPVLEWRVNGSEDAYTKAYPVECGYGRYACKIEGLTSGNISYETQIRFEHESAVGASYKLPFLTKRKPPVEWPYIYISESEVNAETGIALHVVNAGEAAEISWFYDGKEIKPDSDFHYRPTVDGTLKVIVRWEDGSSDTITKYLEVAK